MNDAHMRPAPIRACPVPLPTPDRTLYGPNRTVQGHYFSAASMALHGQRCYAAGLDTPPAEAVRQPMTDADADADAVTDEYRKGFIDGQISINPLTEAQIAAVMHEADWPPAILPPVIKSKLRQLARAIERAHGITGAQE